MKSVFQLSIFMILLFGAATGMQYLLYNGVDRFKSFSSVVQLPESPKAQLLVQKCLATQGYNDPKFKSSWRLSNIGNEAFFRCAIEEKIDYRERERLNICSTNPVRRYSWEEHYIR